MLQWRHNMKTHTLGILMALTLTTHAYEKAFDPTPAGTTEIKTIPQRTLLTSQRTENYFAANNNLFGNLFRYIRQHDLPMTTPVKANIMPGQMGFYIDQKNQHKSLPNTDTVTLTTEPARTVISLGQRGGYSQKNYQTALRNLQQELAARPDWKAHGPPYAIFWNGPYIPNFAKKFEVHIPIEPSQP